MLEKRSAFFTSSESETFNAPDQCGWHSGLDYYSDDYFVPGENVGRGNEITDWQVDIHWRYTHNMSTYQELRSYLVINLTITT